jgi:hypothetical protein
MAGISAAQFANRFNQISFGASQAQFFSQLFERNRGLFVGQPLEEFHEL